MTGFLVGVIVAATVSFSGLQVLQASVLDIFPQHELQDVVVQEKVNGDENSSLPEVSIAPLPYRKNGEPDLVLKAKSYAVLDATSDSVLLEQEADERLPIASLTKLMTAAVILDEPWRLDEVVTISKNAARTPGASIDLVEGEGISVRNLLHAMLIASGNDAAVALAEHFGGSVTSFVAMMNNKAEVLGLSNTEFSTPHGLNGDRSTARDLVQLGDYIFANKMIQDITDTEKLEVLSDGGKFRHELKNTNKTLDNPYIAGGKTGFTYEAGQSLMVLAKSDGHAVITVVLNSPDRFYETNRLVNWVFGSYSW